MDKLKLTNSLKENLDIIMEANNKATKTKTLEQLLQMHFASYLSQLPNKKLVFTNYDDEDKTKNKADYFKECFDYSKNNINYLVFNEAIEPLPDNAELSRYDNTKYYYEFSYLVSENKIVMRQSHGDPVYKKSISGFQPISNTIYKFLATDYTAYFKNYYKNKNYDYVRLAAYLVTLRPYFMQPADKNEHFQKSLLKVDNKELFLKNYMYLNYIVNEIEKRFTRMNAITEFPRYMYPYMHFETDNSYPSSNVFIKPEREVLEYIEPSNPECDVEFKFDYASMKDLKALLNYTVSSLREAMLIITKPIQLAKEIFDYHIPEVDENYYSMACYINILGDHRIESHIKLIEDDKTVYLGAYSPSNYGRGEPKGIKTKYYDVRQTIGGSYNVRVFLDGGINLNKDNKTINVVDEYSFPLINYLVNILKEQNEAYYNNLKDGTEHLLLNSEIFS